LRFELGSTIGKDLLRDSKLGKFLGESLQQVLGPGIGAQSLGDWPTRELVRPKQPLASGILSKVHMDDLKRVGRRFVNK
jgi:hypothetical protein